MTNYKIKKTVSSPLAFAFHEDKSLRALHNCRDDLDLENRQSYSEAMRKKRTPIEKPNFDGAEEWYYLLQKGVVIEWVERRLRRT